MWGVLEEPETGIHHVFPLNDTMTHNCSASCWCKPRNDEGIIVHNAIDPEEDDEEIIEEPDEPDEYLSESEAKQDTDKEAMESDQWQLH